MSEFRFNPITTSKTDRKTFEVFRGRAFYGHLHIKNTGEKIYMAMRHPTEIYRAGNGWAMDEDLIRALRTRAVGFIGVDVVGEQAGEGEQYLTLARHFYPETGEEFGGKCDSSSNRKYPQRFVRIEFFRRKTGVSIASKRYADYAKKWKPKKAEKWEKDLLTAVVAEEKAAAALGALAA